MHSEFRCQDLPFRTPVWNTSVSKNFLSERNRFACELLPDFGGVGVDVRFEQFETFVEPIKSNVLGSQSFYPKCCSLPLISRWNREFSLTQVHIPEYFPNSSCIEVDNELQCLFSTNSERNKLIVTKFEEGSRDEDLPTVFRIVGESFEFDDFNEDNGILREIIKPINIDGSNVLTVKQDNCLTFLEINESDHNLDMNSLFEIDSSKVCGDGDNSFLFQFCLFNDLIPQFLIFCGQLSTRERKITSLMEYDIIEDHVVWQTQPDMKFQYPIGIYVSNHPRIVVYGETQRMGVIDFRINSEECFTDILLKGDIKTVNQWEKFKLMLRNPVNDNQHLVATDCHLIVCDIRFPKGVLLQWNHTINSEDSLDFLKSSERSVSTDFNSFVILISNKSDINLLTIKAADSNCVTPKSLHPPLSISKPSDCYYFSETGSDHILNHTKDIGLIGLKVLPSSFGFSVFQLTNKGDVFVQDFFNKDSDEGEPFNFDYSWRYANAPTNLLLPKNIVDYIIDKFTPQETEETEEIDTKEKIRLCKCCEIMYNLRDQHFENVSPDLRVVIDGKQYANAHFVHFGKVKRKKKQKEIVSATQTNQELTLDDYLNEMMQNLSCEVEERENNNQNGTESDMEHKSLQEKDQKDEIPQQYELKEKILNPWREILPDSV